MRISLATCVAFAAFPTMVSAAPKPVSLKNYLNGNILIMTTARQAPQVVRLQQDGTYDYDTDADGDNIPVPDPRDGSWYIKAKSLCLKKSGKQFAGIPDDCYPIEIRPPHQTWTGTPSLGGKPAKAAYKFQLLRNN